MSRGEYLSPARGDLPVTPPDILGSNQDGDPSHDAVDASITPLAPRKGSETAVSTDGEAAQRDFYFLFNFLEAGRRLDKETAPMPCPALDIDLLKKSIGGLGTEVSVGPPAIKKVGQLAHGEILAGNVFGLPCEGPGPDREGAEVDVDIGPQQNPNPSSFPSYRGREPVGEHR